LVAVVFDWDGTIVDSIPAFVESLNDFCMERLGVNPEISAGNFPSNVGKHTHDEIRRIAEDAGKRLSDEELSKLYDEYYEISSQASDEAPVFPDVPVALQQLNDEGYMLFISSWWDERRLKKLVKAKPFSNLFTLVLGTRGRNFTKGPAHIRYLQSRFSITPKETAWIGDGPIDIKVGRECDCYTIGRIGTLTEGQLLSLGAHRAVKDFRALPDILLGLISP